MTFKLKSQAHIKVYRAIGEWPEIIPVLSRDKTLNPGTVIRTGGSISEDSIEGKGPWGEVNSKITVLDNERLKISFSYKNDLLSRFSRLVFGEEHLYLEDEEIEGQELGRMASSQELWLWARSVHLYQLPEAFTLGDKIRLPFLVAAKKASVEGARHMDIERKTDLIHEPTLPREARK